MSSAMPAAWRARAAASILAEAAAQRARGTSHTATTAITNSATSESSGPVRTPAAARQGGGGEEEGRSSERLGRSGRVGSSLLGRSLSPRGGGAADWRVAGLRSGQCVRTGTPAAASAACASAMLASPKWKIEAARTALAWPSTMPATRWSSAADAAARDHRHARPGRRSRGSGRGRSRSRVPSRSIEVTSNSPAPRSARRSAWSTASMPGRAPAAVGEDLPAVADAARVDAGDAALAAEPLGDVGDHLGPGDRGGIDRDLVRPRQQQRAGVLGGADAAADGQRHEADRGGAADDVEDRAAALVAGARCRGSTVRRRPPRRRRAPARPGRPRRAASTKLTPLTTRPSATSRQGMTRARTVTPLPRRSAPPRGRDDRRRALDP